MVVKSFRSAGCKTAVLFASIPNTRFVVCLNIYVKLKDSMKTTENFRFFNRCLSAGSYFIIENTDKFG